MAELHELANGIRDFLRLRTLPLAVKYLENAEDLNKIEKLRRPAHRMTWCQVIGIARNLGWTIGVTIDDLAGPACIFKLGFAAQPPESKPIYAGIWVKSKEDSVKYVDSLPHLPIGKFKAAAVSPLASSRIESPDLAYIFGNPAQMNLLLNALQWENYERFQFYFTGEGACSDAFVEAYNSGKPQLTVPCLGERIMGLVQDEELEIAFPAGMVKKALDGLNALRAARTIGYPIPYYGYQMDILPFLARTYPGLKQALEQLSREASKS